MGENSGILLVICAHHSFIQRSFIQENPFNSRQCCFHDSQSISFWFPVFSTIFVPLATWRLLGFSSFFTLSTNAAFFAYSLYKSACVRVRVFTKGCASIWYMTTLFTLFLQLAHYWCANPSVSFSSALLSPSCLLSLEWHKNVISLPFLTTLYSSLFQLLANWRI